jgi:hypothetical protein
MTMGVYMKVIGNVTINMEKGIRNLIINVFIKENM